jgi:hypothetical protein
MAFSPNFSNLDYRPELKPPSPFSLGWPQTGTKGPPYGPGRVLGLEDPLIPVGTKGPVEVLNSFEFISQIFLNFSIFGLLNCLTV